MPDEYMRIVMNKWLVGIIAIMSVTAVHAADYPVTIEELRNASDIHASAKEGGDPRCWKR